MSVSHWETYYRGGSLVSCPTGAGPNYTHEVRDAWEKFFGTLADDSRVLDLGCGNGPIALIAKETAEKSGKCFRIDAVDLAAIDPVNDVSDGARLFDGIEFHPLVSTENLPFPDKVMHAVSGQYILEYTEIGKTLAEVARVLTPGGRCQFIIHHAESIIVRNARESLAQATLFDELKLLRHFDRFADAMNRGSRSSAKERNTIVSLVAEMQRHAAESTNALFIDYVINAVGTLMQLQAAGRRGDVVIARRQLDRDIRNWRDRLGDLVGGAKSRDEIESIASIARDCGFESLEWQEQMQRQSDLVGWRLNLAWQAL